MNDSPYRMELNPDYYFPGLSEFRHAALFDSLEYVWDAVTRLEGYILKWLQGAAGGSHRPVARLDGARIIPVPAGGQHRGEGILHAESYILCPQDIIIEELNIAIGKGSVIEPGATVKSPTIIGRGAEIRQGAYIRGRSIIGDDAVVGHATEVKNSVFMDHAEAGHFAYVGDCILGRHVNLGAGTKLANLQLRTSEQKASGVITPITITIDGERYPTGMEKLGAILGDDVETGCNSVTSPGTLIAPDSWVFSNITVRKGVYGANMLIKSENSTIVAIPRRGD